MGKAKQLGVRHTEVEIVFLVLFQLIVWWSFFYYQIKNGINIYWKQIE